MIIITAMFPDIFKVTTSKLKFPIKYMGRYWGIYISPKRFKFHILNHATMHNHRVVRVGRGCDKILQLLQ